MLGPLVSGGRIHPWEGYAAGACEVEDAEVVHEAYKLGDFMAVPGDLYSDYGASYVDDLGAEELAELDDFSPGLSVYLCLEEDELTVNVFTIAKVDDLDDVDELIELLDDLVEDVLFLAHDYGHAADFGIVAGAHI